MQGKLETIDDDGHGSMERDGQAAMDNGGQAVQRNVYATSLKYFHKLSRNQTYLPYSMNILDNPKLTMVSLVK